MFEGMLNLDDSMANLSKIMEKLLDPENIEMKTDVSMKQIRIISSMKLKLALMNEYKKPFHERLSPYEILYNELTNVMILLCSRNRLSREEISKMVREATELIPSQNLADKINLK